MGKYIKLFNAHSEYETFTATSDFIKPNISVCKQENEVHYNPFTYADVYLTFIAKADGTFNFNGNSVSYSLDNGETWATLTSNTDSPTVTTGNRIMWKASLTPADQGIGMFSSTAQFDVEGNPMSLLFGDIFIGQTDLTSKNHAFYNLFNNCSRLINAKNLLLPATTLSDYCYVNMFRGCTSLNYIKAMFTTTPSSTYTSNWVSGVASNGTFVKNSAATWNVTGANGIPTNWTVQTATE